MVPMQHWIDWWLQASPKVRWGLPALLLLASTLLYFKGWFWPWGWGLGGVLILANFILED